MQHSGAGRIADGFPSFFQAIPACQAVGVPSIIDHIQGWKAETLSGDWASLAPRRKKKKNRGKKHSLDCQLCVKGDGETSFLSRIELWLKTRQFEK